MKRSVRRIVRRAAVLVTVVGALAATTSGAVAKTTTAKSVDRNAEFTFGYSFISAGFDPIRVPNPGGDSVFLTNVYDPLLGLVKGKDGIIGPGPRLASSYKVAPDGLSISFELRSGVKFQDGTAFNAAAVKANIERAKGPNSLSARAIASVQSVEVVDDTHVTFRLSAADPSIPWAMTLYAGMMVSPAAFNTDLVTKPVGTGPYTLVSATKDAGAVFERWDGYWDKKAALAKKLTIAIVKDGNARYNGLRSGQYDAVTLEPPTDIEARQLTKDGYHYNIGNSAAQYRVTMNSLKAPFNDPRVRRAVYIGINRKRIVEGLFKGVSVPVHQAFNPGFIGFNESLTKDPYDLKAAQKLVKEAGASGASVNLLYPTVSPYDVIAQALQQQLNAIGLKVQLAPVEPTLLFQTWPKGQYEAGLLAGGRPEPSENMSIGFFPGPYTLESLGAEFTDMAAKAKALPPGSKEQVKAYQDIARWLVENPPNAPVITHWTAVVTRPNVVGTQKMMLLNIGDLDFRYVGIKGKG